MAVKNAALKLTETVNITQ
jgi:hypothetical protein